jgi:hypothetical protein
LNGTSAVMPASSLLPPLRRRRFVVNLKTAISDIFNGYSAKVEQPCIRFGDRI